MCQLLLKEVTYESSCWNVPQEMSLWSHGSFPSSPGEWWRVMLHPDQRGGTCFELLLSKQGNQYCPKSSSIVLKKREVPIAKPFPYSPVVLESKNITLLYCKQLCLTFVYKRRRLFEFQLFVWFLRQVSQNWVISRSSFGKPGAWEKTRKQQNKKPI